MIIKDIQIEKMNTALTDKFKSYAYQYFQNNENYKNMDIKQLQEFVEFGIAKSTTYKIASQEAVIDYIDFVIQYGKNFEINPKYNIHCFANILSASNLSESDKIDYLKNAFTS
jgi:hypothetical protein